MSKPGASFWKKTPGNLVPGIIRRSTNNLSFSSKTSCGGASTHVDDDQDNKTNTTTTNGEPSIDETTTNHGNTHEEPQPSPKRNLRLDKFHMMLSEDNLDMDALRSAAWNGVPDEVRGTVWKILIGYLPTNHSRRKPTYTNRRQLYDSYLKQYHKMEDTEENEVLLKQIRVDVPRMGPGVDWIQAPRIQRSLERLLYIWAIRHPASGYVQGMNDLAVPFYLAYLAEQGNIHVNDKEKLAIRVNSVELLSDKEFAKIEADAFWSVSTLLDGIQDNYTKNQPGIQILVFKLQKLIKTIAEDLHKHLEDQGVQFLLFAFRWFQCILMRELSLHLVIRLWDTLLAQESGFKTFHVYVCAAFLMRFREQLLKMEFQDLVLFLQSVPTMGWTVQDIDMLVAQAYMYHARYHESPNHLR